jgi:hypothetical protein
MLQSMLVISVVNSEFTALINYANHFSFLIGPHQFSNFGAVSDFKLYVKWLISVLSYHGPRLHLICYNLTDKLEIVLDFQDCIDRSK